MDGTEQTQSNVDRAALKVIRAWKVAGSHPDYHREQVVRLEREWPTLAEAVRELAAAHWLKL